MEISRDVQPVLAYGQEYAAPNIHERSYAVETSDGLGVAVARQVFSLQYKCRVPSYECRILARPVIRESTHGNYKILGTR